MKSLIVAASFLMVGVGCVPPSNPPDSTLERALTQMEVSSDIALEEANFIEDLRNNGGCSNYNSVRERHIQKMQQLAQRNEASRGKGKP